MLEINCDASYHFSHSFIGCLVSRDGEQILRLSKRMISNPLHSKASEEEAISFASKLFTKLAADNEEGIIYNDSDTAVSDMGKERNDRISIKHVSRSNENQRIADKLSKDLNVRGNLCRAEKGVVNGSEVRFITEFYCGFSCSEVGETYACCVVFQDESIICQFTYKILSNSQNIVQCNIESIIISIRLAELVSHQRYIFSQFTRKIIIHNECKEAIDHFSNLYTDNFVFQHNPNSMYKEYIEFLCKGFQCRMPKIEDMNKQEVVQYTRDVCMDIKVNNRSVLYINKEKISNRYTSYELVIRSPEKVLYSEMQSLKRGGTPVDLRFLIPISSKLRKAGFQAELRKAGVELDKSYFMITDATWTLRMADNKANSILPASVEYQVICNDSDKSSEYFFEMIDGLE